MNKVRIYFVKGLYSQQQWVDVDGLTLQEVNEKMDELPDEIVSFNAPEGRFYAWRRKHIDRWERV